MLADLSNNCSKEYSFSDFGEVSSVIFEFESVWERFVVKNTALLTLLLLVKYLKNFWIIGLLITSGIVVFSLISNVASDALIPLLVVLAERIARISNIFGASQARHMDTVKKSVRNVDILGAVHSKMPCHILILLLQNCFRSAEKESFFLNTVKVQLLNSQENLKYKHFFTEFPIWHVTILKLTCKIHFFITPFMKS